ncbi:FtsJ-like methyltransferase-domain-containing protein, partial [Chytridium lagenaria]
MLISSSLTTLSSPQETPSQPAARENLRSRASFKLEQMQKAYQLIKRNDVVVDLGGSPEVAVRHAKNGKTISIEPSSIDPIPVPSFSKVICLIPEVQQNLIEHLDGRPVNVVLSDMAHSFTGNRGVDVERVKVLCETALKVAEKVLRPGGNFVCKFIQGEGIDELRHTLQQRFLRVIYDKPPASRSESAEGYLICLNHAPSTPHLVSEFHRSRISSDTTVPPHWRELSPGVKILATVPGEGRLVEAVVETVLARDY